VNQPTARLSNAPSPDQSVRAGRGLGAPDDARRQLLIERFELVEPRLRISALAACEVRGEVFDMDL
jgi:hypothetical protein